MCNRRLKISLKPAIPYVKHESYACFGGVPRARAIVPCQRDVGVDKADEASRKRLDEVRSSNSLSGRLGEADTGRSQLKLTALPDKTGVISHELCRGWDRRFTQQAQEKAKTEEPLDMQDGHASSSFESDSVSDDGDSDPTRSSHTSSSDESEPEEITQEYVHSLLEKVRQDACAEDRREKMLKEDVPYEQDVTKVDAEEEEPYVFASVVAGHL